MAARNCLFARAGLVLIAVALTGCGANPRSNSRVYEIPMATAAPIRMEVCEPGTFIGTMTINCPQVVN